MDTPAPTPKPSKWSIFKDIVNMLLIVVGIAMIINSIVVNADKKRATDEYRAAKADLIALKDQLIADNNQRMLRSDAVRCKALLTNTRYELLTDRAVFNPTYIEQELQECSEGLHGAPLFDAECETAFMELLQIIPHATLCHDAAAERARMIEALRTRCFF